MLSRFKAQTELNLQWTSIPNSGPGNARNAGVAKSAGSWIGFIDADVIPDFDWVKNAIQLIQQKPDAGAFEGRTEVTQRNLATPFTHQTENTDGGRYPTCNFLVRRNLANFHPAYLIPFREDTDLAFSILASGYSIIFAQELIVEHPPLSSSYSRPLDLARRYYYDGLLARRFPSRYRLELDAHQIFGLKIPHLKRKLYAIFVLSQIVFLAALLFGFSSSEMLLPVSAYIAGLCLTAGASLRYAKLKDLSLQDWLVFVFQLHVLPWVMGYSLLRGWFDFRGEPEYLAG
jgi:cellulose synthase/poly-beta-1,6-N-acetylglucosamine synthase-like glycosyltransferase